MAVLHRHIVRTPDLTTRLPGPKAAASKITYHPHIHLILGASDGGFTISATLLPGLLNTHGHGHKNARLA